GDQRDRRGLVGALGILTAVRAAVATTLHDRFKRNVLVRHPARDGGGGAWAVDRGKADVVAAFVALHRRALRLGQIGSGTSERRHSTASGKVHEIGDHRRGGRGAAG